MAVATRQHERSTIFDNLPAELRSTLWQYVFGTSEARIVQLPNRGIYCVKTPEDQSGKCETPALVFVLKRYKAEILEQFYRSVNVYPIPESEWTWIKVPRPLMCRVRRLELAISNFWHLDSPQLDSPRFIIRTPGISPSDRDHIEIEGSNADAL